MLELAFAAPDTEAWSSRVALAAHAPRESQEEPAERSHVCAMRAYRALEGALQSVERLPESVNREPLASPMFAAMMCAYTVLDTPARAAAHADGLAEGQRLIAHAYETLRAAAPSEIGDRLGEQLMEAHAALREGSEALAQMSFDAPPLSMEFFLADTHVSDYSESG